MERYIVKIVELETDRVVKKFPQCSYRRAEQIERGVLIHLNTEKYYVDIQEVK